MKLEENKLEGKIAVSKAIVRLEWEESERGWGVRPDGCSLHLSLDDCEQYVKDYWQRMPDYVPDEYERPCSNPYSVLVDDEIYRKIQATKNGMRLYRHRIHELEDNGRVKDPDHSRKV